ncbi:hypothetical protein RRG08_028950 [Elysia crispata]|uniref:Uncharacterized protein n=1 Tax=Elysia crispata TaxID=231223 RepID=A0AAE1AS84_9GAST|nr:hypothetical protein RRG08_028950 [Elysia crispata]
MWTSDHNAGHFRQGVKPDKRILTKKWSSWSPIVFFSFFHFAIRPSPISLIRPSEHKTLYIYFCLSINPFTCIARLTVIMCIFFLHSSPFCPSSLEDWLTCVYRPEAGRGLCLPPDLYEQ